MNTQKQNGPLVVARRFDGLGGRLNAMVNAAALAKEHGLTFRFVWPRDTERTMLDDPSRIFAQAFLDEFEIPHSALDGLIGRPAQALHDPGEREAAGFVLVDEMFGILRADQEESAAIARQRFRRCFAEFGWAPEIRELMALVEARALGDGLTAIHVRAGDIVNGEWRQILGHEKYTPTPFILLAIRQLRQSGAHVVVVSDSRAYSDWLSSRFHDLLVMADLIPDYGSLSELHRTFIDILVMSHCASVVGPPRSAFSGLAANLGTAPVIRADAMVPAGGEAAILLDGVNALRREVKRSPFLRGMVARDICWYADVFPDGTSPHDRIHLVRRAVRLDPDFCGAHLRLARDTAWAGDFDNARKAVARAMRIAQAVRIHEDPLAEVLATAIAVESLAVMMGGSRRRVMRRLNSSRRRRDDVRAEVAYMHGQLEMYATLAPYQMYHADTLHALRFVTAIADWLSAAGDDLLQDLGAAVARLPRGRVAASQFLPASLDQHHRMNPFDPVLEYVERVAICVSQVVAASLILGAPERDGLAEGKVDGLWTSASGLRWIEGWALGADGGTLVVASAPGAQPGFAGAGPLFLERPDVNQALDRPPGSLHGFQIPAPIGWTSISDGDRPVMTVVSPTGERRAF